MKEHFLIIFYFVEFQQQFLRKLNILNVKVDQIAADVVQLQNLCIRDKPEIGNDNDNIEFNFPLQSIEELTVMETELENKEKYTKLVSLKLYANSVLIFKYEERIFIVTIITFEYYNNNNNCLYCFQYEFNNINKENNDLITIIRKQKAKFSSHSSFIYY